MRRALAAALLAASGLAAQMSVDQKLLDFQALASVYAKQYAPYEWKREVFGFDLMNLKPWLERVRQTRDDLDFYEVCAEYVSSLQDTHSAFDVPSTFVARLGFSVDLYGGKALIDTIDRTRLPESDYPFQIGDELVSLDGVRAEDWIERLLKYEGWGNPVAARRAAAGRITSRSQAVVPRAHEIGDEAVVEIRREDGALETYTVPWRKTGKPVLFNGPVPWPKLRAAAAAPETDYLAPLVELRNDRHPRPGDVRGFGSQAPVWTAPPYFTRRLGRSSSEVFYSGVFDWEGVRIGYLRIPNFGPSSQTAALRLLETEVEWFEQNTAGLVVDVMRNNGGDACYNEEVQRRLIPYPFRSMAREIRATQYRILSFASALESARRQNAEAWVIALLEARLKDLETAYRENRGRTGPLSVCSSGAIELQPARVVYTKPLMVLIDDFSTSAADAFPAVIQDNQRGPLLGTRTNGAGGNTSSWDVGFYSEATTSVTQSLHHRIRPTVTAEYPAAPYIENIGVRPDVPLDYMTRENLKEGGRPFVEAFLAAMLRHIRGEL